MRTRLADAAVALAAAVAAVVTAALPTHAAQTTQAAEAAAAATPGFHVVDGRLQDANGQDFVMRGINHAHTWYPTRTTQALQDIKATGANTVRVVLASGDRWTKNDTADVTNVVSQCKANRLVCVLEVHDTTGYGEQSGAITLAKAVDYWISVQAALKGQEKYVILNLGNEPYGNAGYSTWASDTSTALQRLRTAGFENTLMVDAPNWGQDWSFTMRDNAASVFAADPQRNTMFSIHMYGVFDTAAEVTDYIGRFVTAKLPILVGEFGDMHSDGNPDEDAIMATAQQQRIGYLGWSWSGNGGGVEYLDLVTGFDATKLSTWGTRLINGANGIRSTSVEASVYGGTSSDTQAPTAPGTPAATAVTSTGATLTWAASTDNTAVTAYDVVRVTSSGESAVTTVPGTTAALTGLTPATAYGFAVYARDAAGNRSPRSATVTVTTGPAVTGTCSVSYRISDWGSSFNSDVTVRNLGTAVIDGWALDFAFPAEQKINSIWNAKATQSGHNVHVTNEAWTKTIPAGGSVTFGLNGSSTAGTNGVPAGFTLNSSVCTIVA